MVVGQLPSYVSEKHDLRVASHWTRFQLRDLFTTKPAPKAAFAEHKNFAESTVWVEPETLSLLFKEFAKSYIEISVSSSSDVPREIPSLRVGIGARVIARLH